MRKIVRVGNAIGISIPKEFLHKWGIGVGDFVEITGDFEKDNKLTLSFLKVKKKEPKKYENMEMF